MPQTVKAPSKAAVAVPKQTAKDRPKRDEKFHQRLQESADRYTSTPLPPALRFLSRAFAWFKPVKKRKSATVGPRTLGK